MRSLAALLVLLAVAGCDSEDPGTPTPDPVYIGTKIEYQVSAFGTVSKATVTYSDVDGELKTETVDFSRQPSYTKSFELPARETPRLSLTARGQVDSGRLSTRITVTRLDTRDQVATDTDSEGTTTTTGEFVSVTSTVDVPEVVVVPDE